MIQAVVLGGGIAGLLAAAVRRHVDSVVIVERDALPDKPAHRRGTPLLGDATRIHAVRLRVGVFGAADRVVVAGGGGGAGNGGPLLHGGNGGGLAGEVGGQGGGPAGSGVAGGGATQTADGAGSPHPAGPGPRGLPAVRTSIPRSEHRTPVAVAPVATVAVGVAAATSVVAAAPAAGTRATSSGQVVVAEVVLRCRRRPMSPLSRALITVTAR